MAISPAELKRMGEGHLRDMVKECEQEVDRQLKFLASYYKGGPLTIFVHAHISEEVFRQLCEKYKDWDMQMKGGSVFTILTMTPKD